MNNESSGVNNSRSEMIQWFIKSKNQRESQHKNHVIVMKRGTPR